MDCVLYNGVIRTLFTKAPVVRALAIRDGRVLAVGCDEDMLALAGRSARRVDLRGRTALPGLCDTHMHLLNTGNMMLSANVSAARSLSQAQESLRAYIRERELPPGALVEARGYNQDLFPDKRLITRADLDAVSREHPILLTRVCGHMAVANTALLQACGITADTPVPDGGAMDIETGIFLENAIGLLHRAIPNMTLADIKRRLSLAARAAAREGLTCVYTDDFSEPALVMRAYRELANAGDLPLRVRQQCQLPSIEDMEAFFAGERDAGDDMYALSAVKLFADGSLGARTAWLRAPYRDDQKTRGVPMYPQETLDALVACAQQHGMPAIIHAIGDAAIESALNAIERARMQARVPAPRHGVVHCQITDGALLKRFQQLEAVAYIQPIFLDYDLHICEDRVGETLARTSYAWKTLLDLGVCACAGSDSPVERFSPMPNLCAAVTRQDKDGFPASGWQPQEKLTVDEALRLFTVNAAYAAHEEACRGTLAPGMLADMTVLEDDPFAVAPERIKDVKPSCTLVGGKLMEAT